MMNDSRSPVLDLSQFPKKDQRGTVIGVSESRVAIVIAVGFS
jgi:hypothetical protein